MTITMGQKVYNIMSTENKEHDTLPIFLLGKERECRLYTKRSKMR